MIDFTSAMATTGRSRQNNRNSVKKRAKLPASIAISMMLGLNSHQLEGRKSRESDVTMMTKRSNHMPMLAKVATMKTMIRFVRAFFDQRISGAKALQKSMIQVLQAYHPKARL